MAFTDNDLDRLKDICDEEAYTDIKTKPIMDLINRLEAAERAVVELQKGLGCGCCSDDYDSFAVESWLKSKGE